MNGISGGGGTMHRLLFRSCKTLDSLRCLHARILIIGSTPGDCNAVHLITAYSNLGRPAAALSVLLTSSPTPSILLWNAAIRSSAASGDHRTALHLFHHLISSSSRVHPDKYTFTFALKACAAAGDRATGELVRREVTYRGLQSDLFIATGLIDMYSKFGMVESARRVFDEMPQRDAVSWNAMIAGLAQGGEPREALVLFREMLSDGAVALSSVTLLNLLPSVCELCDVRLCRAVHGFVTRRCILDLVGNGVIDMYSKCGCVGIARRVFDGMLDSRDEVSWGTMISGYVYNFCYDMALDLFNDLRRENMKLNQVSVMSALVAAGETRDLERGAEIHSYATWSGMDMSVSVCTVLVTMYAKCGDINKAKLLFDGMERKDIVAWSAMISAFVQVGKPEEALSLFLQMQSEGVMPNRVTLVSIIPACADLLDPTLGKSLHCFVLKSNFGSYVPVGTALVAMYVQCEFFTSAQSLFDDLQHKDVVAWNALINGYAQVGDAANALQMFHQMRSLGQCPDPGTMVGAVLACAFSSARNGNASVHGLVIKNGFESDLHVKNAIIDMYAKCADLSSAESLFSESKSCEDLISWNTMIAGYVHNGRASKAISTFNMMKYENIKPNLVTLISIFPAAANMASLREGVILHSYVIRTGFESHVLVGNSLIDMYSKCGQLDYARDFFNQMGYRDRVSWNAMLAGYAVHGLGENAFALFSQMKHNFIPPDSVSFIAVLSACRHGGLIEEGRKIFNSMRSEHHLEPKLEHYACMVDLLGRAGQFEEVWDLIQRMPMTPDASVWGALLGACRMHSNVKMGEVAQDHLIRLEPHIPAHYVVLSNIYAQAENWVESKKMREALSRTGLSRSPGCSWVEVKNTVHELERR